MKEIHAPPPISRTAAIGNKSRSAPAAIVARPKTATPAENQVSRPSGSSALHDQRAKHSATAETTKLHSVSNRATVDAMSDGRQQGQKTAREEHRGSRP